MKLWKIAAAVCLGFYLMFHFSSAADRIEDRERKLAGELEKPPKDALDVQRQRDELRKGFVEAMQRLRGGEPEQTVLDKLDALFQKGATIDTFYDAEALETAVLYRAKLVTKLLLDKGAAPDGFRHDSKPLKIATKYGNQEIISLLSQYGATPLKPVDAAQLRFTFAAGVGDIKSIKRELSNGADINFTDSLDQTTALIQAVSFDRLEAVRTLLGLRADPNQSGHVNGIDIFAPLRPRQEEFACAPLHAATLHGGHPEIIRLLLKAGARVSSTNCYKNLTPLHVAAKFQSVSAASVLLKEGAKVMAKDSDGKTPLDYAESGPIIKLLKAYGASEIR
jgi:ankyrin repeat protein